ncbi:MAG: dephospho-CoA kinase [Thermodesulfobacteriota bacterium]|nr:dephospho-CoA kinase [Thermodesulfobacteriota bacterium]
MRIFGLTGSIATGKSLVSHHLKELGAFIIDYDVISKKVVKPGFLAWQDIVGYFGKDILNEDRTIDRVKLGNIIFNDETKRKKLEFFTHIRIAEEINNEEKAILSSNPHAIVIHDAPLLFEANVHKFKNFEKIIVVYANEKTQLKRLKERDGISEEDALIRIRAQFPFEEKVKLADFIIDNNGSIENTKRQVEKVYHALCSHTKHNKEEKWKIQTNGKQS